MDDRRIKVNWGNKVRKFWRIPNESSFDNYFDIVIHDYKSFYDIDFKNDVIIFGQEDYPSYHVEKIYPLLDSGIKFIVDSTYECQSSLLPFLKDYQKNGLVIMCSDKHDVDGWNQKHFCFVPAMFWYMEYFRLNYESPYWENRPVLNLNRLDRKYDFLMPLLKKKFGKELILNLLNESYDMNKVLYSVGWENKFLPEGSLNDRYYNPNWYNSSLYSLVVESSCDQPFFITEKTFKPIMYGHPFIIFGSPGTLKILKEKGFDTFPELFDESYDDEFDTTSRAQLIIKQIQNLDKINFFIHKMQIDTKISDNLNRFFNLNLVLSNIDKDIRQPIEKFLYEQ